MITYQVGDVSLISDEVLDEDPLAGNVDGSLVSQMFADCVAEVGVANVKLEAQASDLGSIEGGALVFRESSCQGVDDALQALWTHSPAPK